MVGGRHAVAVLTTDMSAVGMEGAGDAARMAMGAESLVVDMAGEGSGTNISTNISTSSNDLRGSSNNNSTSSSSSYHLHNIISLSRSNSSPRLTM